MTERTKSSIAIPHVSLEAAKKAVMALYAFKKPGSAKDLTEMAGINKTNTSKALSVARSLGFVTEIDRGVYDLTDGGKQLAQALGYNKEEQAESIIRNAIMTRSEWEEVIAFVRTCVSEPKDPLDLVQHIEFRLDKNWTKSMRNSLASTYKSVLIGAGLIDPSDAMIVPLLDFESLGISDDNTQIIPETKAPSGAAIQDESEYITFEMPNLFILRIKAKQKALLYLRSQVVDTSPIASWIDASLMMIEDEDS